MFTKEHADENKRMAAAAKVSAAAMKTEQLYDDQYLKDMAQGFGVVCQAYMPNVTRTRARHQFYVSVGKERGRRIRERDNVSHA